MGVENMADIENMEATRSCTKMAAHRGPTTVGDIGDVEATVPCTNMAAHRGPTTSWGHWGHHRC